MNHREEFECNWQLILEMYYVSVKCIALYVTIKTSFRYLSFKHSIFAVQQSMIAAPNLTSKESRKDWETAFSSSVVGPTLTVCLPLLFGSLKWFYISFSMKYINFGNKITRIVMTTRNSNI